MNIEELYTVEAHETGAEMQVKNQSGKLTEMFITLIGVDSKKWRKLVKDRRKVMLDGTGDPDADDIKMLVNASIGWRGFMSNDKEIEFTKQNIKALYENAPYIAEQADRFIAKRSNFIKG